MARFIARTVIDECMSPLYVSYAFLLSVRPGFNLAR